MTGGLRTGNSEMDAALVRIFWGVGWGAEIGDVVVSVLMKVFFIEGVFVQSESMYGT